MPRPASALQKWLELAEPERRIGPFVLVEQLGRGGFAPVWLARETYGETVLRWCAVKLFSLDAPGNGIGAEALATRQRAIVDEARALCRIEHPAVVRFYALPRSEDGTILGLAMEHVAGTSLDKRLASTGRLGLDDALGVGAAVASALSAVHGAGLVHRDVKPANVIEANGVVKLIDFGIAAADEPEPTSAVRKTRLELGDLPPVAVGSHMGDLQDERGDVTVPVGLRSGTVGYIDPICVASGAPATTSSDLYALGAMLFECITGKVPAGAGVPKGAGLRGDVLDGRARPPPISDVARDVPKALAQLVDGLLDPDRKKRPASAESVAIRLQAIRVERAGTKRDLPSEAVGPFRGLGHFDARDRSVYFGRSAEVAAALETLRTRGLLALVGPSGSGKSSLARAGLVPAVVDGGLGGWPKRWDVATATPGSDPRAAIAEALAPFVDRASERTPEELVEALAERAPSTGWGVLLLVDQLEELATSSSGSSRAWTAELLARIGERPLPGVRAVVTARRDLLDPLLALPDLGRVLVRGSVLIEPMPDAAWTDVIEQALAAYGYAFEDDDVLAQVLDELRGAAMPLVQFALAELWRSRDTAKKRITRASVRALGGIAAALERHAEATLAALTAHGGEAEERVRQVFLVLTTAQGTRMTRPLVSVLDAGGQGAMEIVEAFERARLLVRSQDGIRIAHEALLVQWGRLRAWVAEGREDRLLADALEDDARRWKEDHDATPVWQKRKLAHALELRRRSSVVLSDGALAFLDAAQLASRRTRFAIVAIAALVVASAAIAVGTYVRSARRELALETQRSREIQGKQAEIDELVATMRDSEEKQKVLALQAEIRGEPVPTSASAAPTARAAAKVAVVPQPPPVTSAAQAPEAAPPPPPPTGRKSAIETTPPF